MYNKLGTWSTIGCPYTEDTEKCNELIAKAEKYLSEKFADINGKVWVKYNSHDIATYPSFEVDVPSDKEDAWDEYTSGDYDSMDDDDFAWADNWDTIANEIETEYTDKYNEYL